METFLCLRVHLLGIPGRPRGICLLQTLGSVLIARATQGARCQVLQEASEREHESAHSAAAYLYSDSRGNA